MSAWLTSFSLPNPFKSDSVSNSDSDADDDQEKPSLNNQNPSPNSGLPKELSQTISHHLRGVASFFDFTSQAPLSDHPRTPSNSDALTGIKNDFVEIGGSIKALLSSSSNNAAAKFSSFASNLLKFKEDDAINEVVDDQEEEEDDDVPGIDQEVLAFARTVSMRPEVWTEFPLPLEDDFDMSDSQREHAASVEHLVPSLATLRQEISGHVGSGKFWLIYFILLLPRLDESDAKLLSSPKIVQTREKLLLKLQNNNNAQVGTSDSEAAVISEIGQGDESSSQQKDSTSQAAVPPPDIREVKSGKSGLTSVDEVADRGKSSRKQNHSDSMEDVSFSDLEDEDSDISDRMSGLRISQSARLSSASESNEWIRLKGSSGTKGGQAKAGSSNLHGKDSESEGSSGWLTVDDVEVDSVVSG